MPRPLPLVRAGGWYHVVNRGIDQSMLFPTAQAKDRFIFAVCAGAYAFAVEVHAYCAMESHYHLLARAAGHRTTLAFDRK